MLLQALRVESETKNPAPDLDGGGPWAQAWWEVPCSDRT